LGTKAPSFLIAINASVDFVRETALLLTLVVLAGPL